MKKNMGTIDRVARILVAILIGYLYFTKQISGTLGIVPIILAVVFLVTTLITICPLYLPFGLKTTKKQ